MDAWMVLLAQAEDGEGVSGLANLLPTLLIAGGAAVLMMTLIRGRKKRVRKENAQAQEPSERIAEIRQRTSAVDDMGVVAANLQELAQRLCAQMDQKAAKIEILIEQADEKLRALDAAQQRPRAPAPPAPVREEPLRMPERGTSTDPLHRRVYELADAGKDVLTIAREIGKPTGQVELILALRRA